mmetsp:Transcript_41796/g.75244  ORF Transcript_41796/g.75244 Transcript_41796/m.75244 type:complete len:368 (-) Transcript_41796:135-1238(-)
MRSICLLTILAIAVATKASHSSANKGWIRQSPNLLFANSPRHNINSLASSDTRHVHPTSTPLFSLRGGSSTHQNEDLDEANDEDDEEDEMQRQKREEYEKLSKYRMEQQMLYQLRSTYLSEMLAARGVPLPTIMSVSTTDGEKPPEKVDWDCALSTDDDPKSCLYSFDAEPDTKVVAPFGTDQWISLSALNRLRRTDPTKVEPMWHSRYSILQSWFSDASEFSMLQHVGVKGFFISSVLLDGANGMVLRSLLILSVVSALILLMPLIEYIVGRIIVSAPFWAQWMTWGRIARAGFPLKLLLGQLAWKGVASCFAKVENEVREYIVDMECEILEESVPVTVGVGSEEEITEEEMEMESEDFDEYDEEY